jgi:hypothetical protein
MYSMFVDLRVTELESLSLSDLAERVLSRRGELLPLLRLLGEPWNTFMGEDTSLPWALGAGNS